MKAKLLCGSITRTTEIYAPDGTPPQRLAFPSNGQRDRVYHLLAVETTLSGEKVAVYSRKEVGT